MDPSSFLGAVMAVAQPVDWRALPIAVTNANAQVELRIYDGFEIRQRHKDELGLQFADSTKAWYVFRPADGFDFGHVRQVLSIAGPRLIEVRDGSQRVIHQPGGRPDRGCLR